jgi:uncharacterized iron-regulated membrane protein
MHQISAILLLATQNASVRETPMSSGRLALLILLGLVLLAALASILVALLAWAAARRTRRIAALKAENTRRHAKGSAWKAAADRLDTPTPEELNQQFREEPPKGGRP